MEVSTLVPMAPKATCSTTITAFKTQKPAMYTKLQENRPCDKTCNWLHANYPIKSPKSSVFGKNFLSMNHGLLKRLKQGQVLNSC